MGLEDSYNIGSYKKINFIFAIIIVGIFIYCYFSIFLNFGFRSACEGMPLQYCKSRGLTRAFSQILLFNFQQALILNPYSIKIFLFFLLQLSARLIINKIIQISNFKIILKLDIVLSAAFFLFSFYNLIYGF